ncbi:hypothetical protein I4U23_006688 [Adineta vaga]|nr:hypothetical protein I4U23_006688 [Adineta vaga]
MGRDLPCGIAFMRGILLLLNIIFVLLGVVLVGLGIYLKVDTHFAAILDRLAHVSNFQSQSLGFLAFILIGGGIFTVLISLLGCIGTLRHNRCLLYSYAIIVIVLMILELAGFITAFAYRNKLESVYNDGLTKAFTDALDNNDTIVLNVFHDLEHSLKCCGINGGKDYDTHSSQAGPDCFLYRNKGCSKAIIDLLEKNLPIIGSSLGVLLLFELVSLIFAFVLAHALKNSDETNFSSSPSEVLSAVVPNRRANYRKF